MKHSQFNLWHAFNHAVEQYAHCLLIGNIAMAGMFAMEAETLHHEIYPNG